MSDVVGSVAFNIELDASAFADLNDLIIAAVSNALGSVSALSADIGSAVSDPILAALDTAAAGATDAGTLIGEAVADATASGVDAAITSVDGLGDEFATVADEVSGATQGMGDEIDSTLSAAFDAADAAAAAASTSMSDSLRESIAPAIEDSSTRARDELGKFTQDSTDAGTSAGQGLAQGVRAGADDMTATMQSAATQIGTIMAGVFAGNELTKFADTAVESLQEVVTALPELGESFHAATSRIRVGTGETGALLEGLEEDFRGVAARTPASFDQVSQAITVLNQRLGLTGQPLQDLSYKFVTFSRITGTDLASNLQTVTGVFNNFNVSADAQGGKLNELLRVYQQTGVPVATLTSAMASLGPVAREVGLSFEDTASIVGQLGRAGLDAGTIQMGLTRIMKQATKDHVGFAQELQNVFSGIKNGVIDQTKAMELFGPRGVKLFDLIRSGTLDYKQMAAAIAAGGDTIEAAAADVTTWQAQLGILGNQLRLVLEPIATFVFGRITDAMRALRPVLVAVAEAAMTILAPAWQSLVLTLAPLWDLLDRVRHGIQVFLSTFDESAPIIDVVATAIGNFVQVVAGTSESGDAVAGWVQTIVTAVQDLWATLEPARDLVASVFDAIRTAIGDFVAANPVPVLVGIATVIGGFMVTAFGALAGVILSVLAPVAGFVAGLLAVPVAIGVAVAALVAAYNNIQVFHDIVDAVAATLSTVFITGLQGAASFLTDTLVPGIRALVIIGRELWDAFSTGNAAAVGNVLTGAFGGEWAGAFQDAATTVMGALSGLLDALDALWSSVSVSILPALQRLWDTLGGGQGILTWISDHWQIIAAVVLAAINPFVAIAAAVGFLYAKFEPVRAVIDAVIDVLVAFAANLAGLVGPVIGDVIDGISGLIEIVQGLFTLDFSRIADGLADFGHATLTALSDILGNLPDFVLNVITGVMDALLGQLGKIPILGNLFDGIRTIVDGVAHALSGVFEVIAGIFSFNWDQIKDGLGNVLGGLRDAIAGVFGGLGGFLHDALVAALPAAWAAIRAAVPALINAFGALLSNLPGWLLAALGALGSVIVTGLSAAWGWVVANGPTILANVAVWLSGLPGTILGWLGDIGPTLLGWLANAFTFVASMAGTIVGDLVGFVTGIPQLLLNALSAYLSFMLTFFYNAIAWTVANLPGILSAVYDFFMSIPDKIGAAIGNLGDWLMQHVFIPAGVWLYLNLPTILDNVYTFFRELPMKLIGLLSGLGANLVTWLADAFKWLVDNGPSIISGVIDFFGGLPGKIFGAIINGLKTAGGAVGDLAKSLWGSIARFLNEKLIDPFRNFSVSIGPQSFTPFQGIPRVAEAFARGGVVDQPTLGVFGEAGREALIPLDDVAAGVAVARQAGLPQMLADAGAVASQGATVNVNLYLTVPPGTTPDQAHDLGEAAMAGAAGELDRNATIRTLVRGAGTAG